MRSSDAALRLVAVAIAVGLFVVVRGERQVTLTFAVPVAPRVPPSLAVASPNPAEVSVTVTGPWSRLRAVAGADLGPVVVEVARAVPGTASWLVRPEAFHAPRGVRVDSIYPAQGTIELSRADGTPPPAGVERP